MESGEAFQGQYSDLTHKIIGAFRTVYNELGPGFLESVYRRSLCVALGEAGLQVEEEASIEVFFHGHCVGIFRADLLVEGHVLIELKVAESITSIFEAQLLHYLRATNIEVGLILCFGSSPTQRRLNYKNSDKEARKLPTPIWPQTSLRRS